MNSLSISLFLCIKRISHTQSRSVSDFDSKVPHFSDNRSKVYCKQGKRQKGWVMPDWQGQTISSLRALALCLCSSRFLSSNLKKSLTHGWLYESFRFRRTRCCMLTAYPLHLHSGCSFKIHECLYNKKDGLVCVSLITVYFESCVLACAVLD